MPLNKKTTKLPDSLSWRLTDACSNRFPISAVRLFFVKDECKPKHVGIHKVARVRSEVLASMLLNHNMHFTRGCPVPNNAARLKLETSTHSLGHGASACRTKEPG